MADQNTLTTEQQHFFETGELTGSLATEQATQQAAQQTDPVQTPQVQQSQVPEQQQPPNMEVVELLRQSLYSEQQARAQAEAKAQQLLQAQQTAQQSVPPDANTDPLGAMMHQLNQITAKTTELQAQLLQQQQAQQNTSQLQQFQSAMRQVRDEFVKTTPDFQQAYDHLRANRTEDLRSVGADSTQIQQILSQDELNIAQSALRLGKNPAAVLYEMAKRHGYSPNTQQTPAQKLEVIQRGQSAASPNVRAPQNQIGDITIDSLKNSSEADLNAIVHDDKAWAKLTGGAYGKDIF